MILGNFVFVFLRLRKVFEEQRGCRRLSRAGATLLEIVTKPDIRSEEHAVETVSDVIQMARYLEISNEHGRRIDSVDVNMSVRRNDVDSNDDDATKT